MALQQLFAASGFCTAADYVESVMFPPYPPNALTKEDLNYEIDSCMP